MPKNLKGVTLWDFYTSILLQNIKNIEGTLLETLKSFFGEKVSQSQKGVRKSQSQKKLERGTFCFGIVLSHVKGFGCLHNQVLNNYGENGHSPQQWTI